MQVQQVTEGVQDLTSKIFSSDISLIAPYLGPQVTYSSALVKVHGRKHVRQAIQLGRLTVVRTWERVKPRDEKRDAGGGRRREWDASSHTLTIHTHTTYGLLFALPLIDVQFTFPSTLRLTLQSCEADDEAADGADDSAEVDVGMYTDDEASSTVPGSQPAQGTGAFATDSGVVPERQSVGEDLDADDAADAGQDDDGRVYYITRWEEEGVLDKAINAVGVVRKIHQSLILPYVLTPALLLLAAVLTFWEAHPLRNGIGAFVRAAIAAVWSEMTGEVSRRLGAHGQDSRKRVEDAKHQVKQMVKDVASSARSTARQAQSTARSAATNTTSTSTSHISSSSSTYSPPRHNPAEHLTPGKATASTGSTHAGAAHHTGLDAQSAEGGGTSYAKVAATGPEELGQDDTTGSSSRRTSGEHDTADKESANGHGHPHEHHVPTEPDAPSYAAVVEEG